MGLEQGFRPEALSKQITVKFLININSSKYTFWNIFIEIIKLQTNLIL